jgi:hypothetical protein
MILSDLQLAKKEKVLKENGFADPAPQETLE